MADSKKPVCLSIGGSDSCGGAGVQADLRVFEALAVHGCSAITALTAQNPAYISRVEAVSLPQLDAEMHAVFDYYDVVAVKTGMLFDVERIALVSALLHELHNGIVVVDPVLVASTGKRLLQEIAVDTLIQALLPITTLLTPNLHEAAVFLGADVTDLSQAASQLTEKFGCAVLLKGGHSDADILLDVLCDSDGQTHPFTHDRQVWSAGQAHGTGCRLASAVTANLAHGKPLRQAVEHAINYLQG
ncbi:MAG: bifunctional hydroxymethylpyrimidine kinase/phosphomethylpyrimidine kinase [Mariprofundus sp.]|nr:bifunctional hydroxymethylpyrimidine kinase/phosphomethylpyrimidine kinase [Mariprofundus sp.]